MNSRGRLDHCGVVQPTIFFSLIFTGLNILRDAILDTVISFSVIQTNDCVVEWLDACGCQQINFRKNGLMLEASIFVFFNINVRVQLLHFSSAFPLCSSRFSLRSWMLGLLLICASFDNFFLLSLRRTGTIRARSCCFILLIKL